MARAIWSSSSSPGLGGSGRTAARARPGRARVRMAIESVRRITVHLRARGRWGFSEECWYFTMPPPAPVGTLARLLLEFAHAHGHDQLLLAPLPAADPAARQPVGGSGLRPRVRRADGGGAGGAGADVQPAAAAAPPRRLLPLDPGHPARHAGAPL